MRANKVDNEMHWTASLNELSDRVSKLLLRLEKTLTALGSDFAEYVLGNDEGLRPQLVPVRQFPRVGE